MVRLTDRPNMTLNVYRGRKTTTQQQQYKFFTCFDPLFETSCKSCVSFKHKMYGDGVNQGQIY